MNPELALQELTPGAAWRIDWDDTQTPPAYSLIWLDAGQAQPSQAQIDAKIAEIAARPGPPQWGDFMDAIAPTLTDPLMAELGDRQQYLMLRLVRLETGAEWKGANDAVFTYWNNPSGPVLTPAQYTTLTTALADHHIPATATRDGVTGIVTIAHQP